MEQPRRPPAEAADLLSSSLPAHLLEEILKRLGIRDVVRTSALSRAWRRRWESLPGIAMCFPRRTRPSVIDRVLLRYTGPSISRFASVVVDYGVGGGGGDDDYYDAPASHVDDWLIALSRRGVESIDICFDAGFPDEFTLHSSIFSCSRLVSLSLDTCSIPPQPGFAGFPVLQELCLVHVDGGTELQAMIRGSPLLRALVLRHVYAPVDCLIEAPNLQTLEIDAPKHDGGWRFGNLPRLQYASVFFPDCLPCGRDGRHRFLEFFTGVSQVRELIFNSPAHEVKIGTIPFTFHNLKSLELSTYFDDVDSILLMFSLLRSSSNLEKLKIEVQLWEPELEENSNILVRLWEPELNKSWDVLSEEWTDGMCANLLDVQINSYINWFPLSFLKLILSKANLLCTLSVDVCPVSQDDPLNELLKCRRASAQAQVLFKKFCNPMFPQPQKLPV